VKKYIVVQGWQSFPIVVTFLGQVL